MCSSTPNVLLEIKMVPLVPREILHLPSPTVPVPTAAAALSPAPATIFTVSGNPQINFQPIVENAIKHSVEFHTETVEIKLTAQKENGIISFCFSNNYAELKPVELENLKRKFTEDYRPNETEVKSLGIGLYNVYRRLKLMYGSNAELQVHYENHMFMLVINIKTEAKGRKET